MNTYKMDLGKTRRLFRQLLYEPISKVVNSHEPCEARQSAVHCRGVRQMEEEAGGVAPDDAGAAQAGESKRKSRWGDKDAAAEEGAKKKSRWGSKDAGALVPGGMPGMPGMPGFVPGMPGAMAPINPEQLKIQGRLNEIQRILAQPNLESVEMANRFDPDKCDWIQLEGGRSPSPPPVYDRMGKRTNTRDVRLRDGLQKERLALVEKLMKLQPNGQGAHMMSLMPKQQTKVTNKIWVPVKEYPGYPFIGLILGPRGNTQKKLERETGAQILKVLYISDLYTVRVLGH